MSELEHLPSSNSSTMVEITVNKFPRIIIQYCSKCKWQNRAIWYLQEIFQTFNYNIKDVSIQPILDHPGIFQIILIRSNNEVPEIIYKRRFKKTKEPQNEEYYFDGFPDSKFLKILIRNKLYPNETLGHIDKYSGTNLLNDGSDKFNQKVMEEPIQGNTECKPCKNEESQIYN